MGLNLTYKILKNHLVSGKLASEEEIGIKIDQTLTQDATGTMAYLQFEAMAIPRIKTELSVSYVDHNTLQVGFENADDHRYLQTVAAKYGIKFSRAGNGICHQVHLERFAKPGKTLLGSDSHTPTAGGIGMLAIGAGGLDVAVAMSGSAFYLTAPRVIRVELKGKLRSWVSAKDVILYILSILSTKGNVNNVLEYCGEGVRALSVPERATIANMGAETGVTTSIFPSDEITRQFLIAQDRKKDWQQLSADAQCEYAKTLTVDLSKIVPMASVPHSPGNVVPIKKIAGEKVDQVIIGSCTNSSLRDLMVAGKILEGKTVHPDVSLAIAPGSRQVLSMISKNGTLSSLIDSGARIMESVCGFCIGIGQAPKTNAISLRTSNRNFEGRSGTKSAKVYLVSPETAAFSAITGRIANPWDKKGKDIPRFKMPDKFDIDDRMIIQNQKVSSRVTIYRGPNIGTPPKNTPLLDKLTGNIAIKVADKITTDHIMPAGSYLKYRSNVEKYSEFVFKEIDPDFSCRALKLKAKKKAVFILAGESYGQGSSREHAAMCPMYLGVKAVFAKSFERIHAANLVNFGILPLVFVRKHDYDRIEKYDVITIFDIFKCLDKNRNIVIQDDTKKIEFELRYILSARQKEIIKAGGLLNFTKGKRGR
ncbi:MAG: aconitate hydratase [Candidatus Omnitrophota bacterium]